MSSDRPEKDTLLAIFMRERARMRRALIAYDSLPANSAVRRVVGEQAEEVRRVFFAL